MIPVNELRIGSRINQHGEPTSVYQIEHRFKTTYRINDIDVDERTISDKFTPIPLTSEMLEKIGFVQDDVFEEKFGGVAKEMILKMTVPRPDGEAIPNEFVLSVTWIKKEPQKIKGAYTVNGFWGAKDFQYLHQLQNIYFVLTGEELALSE